MPEPKLTQGTALLRQGPDLALIAATVLPQVTGGTIKARAEAAVALAQAIVDAAYPKQEAPSDSPLKPEA